MFAEADFPLHIPEPKGSIKLNPFLAYKHFGAPDAFSDKALPSGILLLLCLRQLDAVTNGTSTSSKAKRKAFPRASPEHH